jgi:uncharacterized integral membrane protein (TIGR00697 family)
LQSYNPLFLLARKLSYAILKDSILKKQAFFIYMILAALFIASLVASNLIFKKFFFWDFFGLYTFEISVGILPYPITFLITDTISEIYGKKKANQVVTVGIFASLFTLLIILVSDAVPAIENSPIGNEVFSNVFGSTGIAVSASMIAYLLAQYIDISIYHFWKRLTNGKHLWLRNNFSTFSSQFVDTITVIGLLSIFGELPWEKFWVLVLSGFLFKVIVAVFDTPFLYLIVYSFKSYFKLKPNKEIQLD